MSIKCLLCLCFSPVFVKGEGIKNLVLTTPKHHTLTLCSIECVLNSEQDSMVGFDCQRGQGPSFLTAMLRGGTGNEVERKERGIGEYGREEGRERNMGIWKRGGKR